MAKGAGEGGDETYDKCTKEIVTFKRICVRVVVTFLLLYVMQPNTSAMQHGSREKLNHFHFAFDKLYFKLLLIKKTHAAFFLSFFIYFGLVYRFNSNVHVKMLS